VKFSTNGVKVLHRNMRSALKYHKSRTGRFSFYRATLC